jgi:hypothetical protein
MSLKLSQTETSYINLQIKHSKYEKAVGNEVKIQGSISITLANLTKQTISLLSNIRINRGKPFGHDRK